MAATWKTSHEATMKMLRAVFAASLYAFLFAGCARLVPAEGKVLLDGQPLAGATVSFIPVDGGGTKGAPKLAGDLTDKNGVFRLQSKNASGAVPGVYKVLVSKRVFPAPTAARPNPGFQDMIDVVPVKYTIPNDTPLQVEIPRTGKTDFVVDVKSEK